VGPRAGLDDVEKSKFLTLPGLELRLLGRPARSQSLYRLRLLEIYVLSIAYFKSQIVTDMGLFPGVQDANIRFSREENIETAMWDSVKFTIEAIKFLMSFSSEHNTRKGVKTPNQALCPPVEQYESSNIKRGVQVASFLNLIMSELKQEYLMRHKKKERRSIVEGVTRQD
jgi:hypothetical protein